MLWSLFWTFLLIGFISFGGGYAMIPVIEMEVSKHGWLTTQEFTDAIAIAGMSPGPIATNSAIFVGYKADGLAGAIVSTIGMVIPSLLIVLIVAIFFYKAHQHKMVRSSFYGLKPVVTGFIFYAAIRFAVSNHVIDSLTWHTASLLLIFAGSLLALLRFHVHPLMVILVSGLVGILFYG